MMHSFSSSECSDCQPMIAEVARASDGTIVGSAIVRRITQCIEDKATPEALVESLEHYVDDLFAATRA